MSLSDPAPTRGSLRSKLIRSVLVVVVLVGAGTLSVVSFSSARTAKSNLAVISKHIESQLGSKGRSLVEHHTLALRGMVEDNAFSDMEQLVTRTVERDPDLAFGILANAKGQRLAFAARGVPRSAPQDSTPWLALGFPAVLPAVPALQTRRIQVSGSDVLEFAAPVYVDEELVGTLRYGLSTRTMQEALNSAEGTARTDLLLTLLSLSCLVGLVGLGGVAMGRREATRIVRPLLALTKAARNLAAGHRQIHVQINSGDELELLGNAFDQMATDLAASYASLEELNRGLEQKVELRTAQLAGRNRDMRVVLDNVAQGLVTIDAQGTLAPEHSRAVETWFGPPTRALTLADYLQPLSKQFASRLRLGLSQIRDGFLPSDLLLAQLPTQLITQDREYSFSYAPLGVQSPIHGLLVVIEDITETVAHQREERCQQEVLRAVQHLTRDRTGFRGYLKEAERLLTQVRETISLVELKRALHTLKGSSSVFGLSVVVAHCEALEQGLTEKRTLPPLTDLDVLMQHWNALRKSLEPFMGGMQRDIVEIPRTELESLLPQLAAPRGALVAQSALTAWLLEPVSKPLGRLTQHAANLAERLGRAPLNCKVQCDGTRLDSDTWAPFWSAMVHVVRNAVDHGLEPREVRLANGKGPGQLIFQAESDGNHTTVRISDDGRGIDWDRVRQRAQELGFPSSTPPELLDALLNRGLSTRLQATEISGRGMGMGAVAQTVNQLGGTIHVESSTGKGTTWTFTLPTRLPESALSTRTTARRHQGPPAPSFSPIETALASELQIRGK